MSLIQKLAEKVMSTLSQRGEQNGYDKKPGTAQEERSATQVARVFNALTGHNLSTTDAWTFLQVLKLVRMETQIKMGSGDLLDSCVDMVGYSLLKAETALQDHRPAQVEALNSVVLDDIQKTAEAQQCHAVVAAASQAEKGFGRRVDTGNRPVFLPEDTFKAIDHVKHADDRS